MTSEEKMLHDEEKEEKEKIWMEPKFWITLIEVIRTLKI